MLTAFIFRYSLLPHFAVTETDLPSSRLRSWRTITLAKTESSRPRWSALDYHINLAANETAAIVLVNGRSESIEICRADLRSERLGFSVHTYDHADRACRGSSGCVSRSPMTWNHFDAMAADLPIPS